MKNKVLIKHLINVSILSIIMFFMLCSKSKVVYAEESEFEKIAKLITTR